MTKKEFVRVAALVLLFVGLTAGAYAQVTISGGFALSSVEAKFPGGYTISGKTGIGANVYLDYLLPIGIPLSLGGEIGVDNATLKEGDYEINITAIPLLLRAAYHFDLHPKMDLYLVGKVGYALGASEDIKDEEAGGFAFGFDVGAAYYFTSNFGIFGEVGFDRYMLETTGSYKVELPFSRFLTAGVSIKL